MTGRAVARWGREQVTVAVAGDSPVVCRALVRLLEAAGYGARILDPARKTGMERALAEAHVLLLAAWTAPGLKKPLRQRAGMPVLELITTREASGEGTVLWPCTVEELGRRISAAAVLPAQARERTPEDGGRDRRIDAHL